VRQIPHQFWWLAIQMFNNHSQIFATALFAVTVAIQGNEMNFAIVHNSPHDIAGAKRAETTLQLTGIYNSHSF
jgi:hypothetical protein